MSKLEKKLYENAKRLISPLGAFHWRGTDDPDARLISDGKQFHYSEMGDCTYHTGVLLGSLAFRYKYNPNKTEKDDTLKTIKKLINYYRISQEINEGMFVRDFVDGRAYDLFLPQNKHGNAGFSLFDKAGGHMRYVHVIQSRTNYMARYDISADPISVSVAGFYWVQKFIPELKDEVYRILDTLYSTYEDMKWIIRDKKNEGMLRYGFHKPFFFNPFCSSTRLILRTILDSNLKGDASTKRALWFMNRMKTWIPGVWRSKEKRNFFNTYVLLMLFSAIYDMGYDVKQGLQNMIKETENENNYFANAINNWFSPVKLPEIPGETFPVQNYHPVGKFFIHKNYKVLFEERSGYNHWEVSPYEKSVSKLGCLNGPLGNEAFLQAYWYSKHKIGE